MSRTDKDAPFWVRLNNEATGTRHDHLEFGREHYRHFAVKDEQGNVIFDEVPVTVTADVILGERWNAKWWNYCHRVGREEYSKVMDKARLLKSAGRGSEEIILEYRKTMRTTSKLVYVTKDYCTAGEKVPSSRDVWWGELPCVPEFTDQFPYWRYASPRAKRRVRKTYYGRTRGEARNTLRNMTKAANGGDEGWEDDYEKVERLTQKHRHSMLWELW